MPALVPELVNMASDPTVSSSDLLRRALVVARRLDIPELVDWINSELNGYTKDIPEHRIIRGQLLCVNPINGLIPLMGLPAAHMDVLTRHAEKQSIPELEQIFQSDGELVRYFPPDVEQRLMSRMGDLPMRPVLSLSQIQVKGIIEKVKNRVLNWALDLESRGILGDGMTFTPEEKQTVQALHYHFGDVTGSQIQISSHGSGQTQTNNAFDIQALNGLIEALSSVLTNSSMSQSTIAELRAELDTLRAQVSSPKPKWEIIKSAARSIKAVMESASGSILASLAQPHVTTLIALAS